MGIIMFVVCPVVHCSVQQNLESQGHAYGRWS